MLPEKAATRVGSLLVGLAIAAYLGLAVFQITLPGMHYDEAIHAPAAVALVSGNGEAIGLGVSIGSWRLPVMTGEYVGALRSYALLPLFALFGPGVATFRLTMILLVAVGLFFTARFAKEALGWIPAIVGTWLIASDPTFILATRGDWGPVAIAFALRTGALYFGWRWWRSRGESTAALCAMSVMLGLGVWDKANFLWFVVALVLTGGVAWFLSSERPRLSKLGVTAAVIGFALGVAPLLAFNLIYDWVTFRLIVVPGKEVTISGLIALIVPRARALMAMFHAKALADWMTGVTPLPGFGAMRSLLLPLTLIANAALIVVACWRRRPWFAFLPAVTFLMLFQMFCTPRPIWIHHYLSIYPFPQLAIGVVAGLLWDRSRETHRRSLALVSSAIVVVALILNFVTMAQIHRNLGARGGAGPWSDAIYSLALTLQRDFGDRQIQVMDWGMFNQLYLLGGGKLKLFEPIYSIPDSLEPDERILRLVSDSRNVFVVHSTKETNMKYVSSVLDEAAKRKGIVIKRAERISARSGVEMFRIIDYSSSTSAN